jgi:uncharacterized protein DUF6932
MIPAYTNEGLLPAGVHWAESLTEIEEHFGVNGHRLRLFVGFSRGCNLLQAVGCREVFLDGSFTTVKETPKDFDACWETDGVDFKSLDPIFLDHANLRAAQKVRFFGEFLPVTMGRAPARIYRETFDLFQRDKQTGKPKGIVGLRLQN